jgi:hypothetical protein
MDSELVAGPGVQTGPGLLSVVGRWHSAALGDTCLFHVRGGQLEVAFPLTQSSDFDTSPSLLGS